MNEINAVYDIDDIQDLHEKIIDAVEISKKLETADTNTHFLCGSLFGLIPIENILMSSFQLMVSYLWHQNSNIKEYENKHFCTFLRGSRGFAKTGDESLDSISIASVIKISKNLKNFLSDKRFIQKTSSPIESVGDDFESFNQYFHRTESTDMLFDIDIVCSTFFNCLPENKKSKDSEAEFQLFLNEQRALMKTEDNWRIKKQSIPFQLLNNDLGDGSYFYHSCFRLRSSINPNIVKEEWLRKIDWKININRNAKLKKERKKVYEDQLRKTEKRIKEQCREIDNFHEKHHQVMLQKLNSELKDMSITGCQRRKIQRLIEGQFEEIYEHYKKRHDETMQEEKEDLERHIIIINDELKEIEKTNMEK